jgi:hypothetical protein
MSGRVLWMRCRARFTSPPACLRDRSFFSADARSGDTCAMRVRVCGGACAVACVRWRVCTDWETNHQEGEEETNLPKAAGAPGLERAPVPHQLQTRGAEREPRLERTLLGGNRLRTALVQRQLDLVLQ